MKKLFVCYYRYTTNPIKAHFISSELNILLKHFQTINNPKLEFLKSLSSQQQFRKYFDERVVSGLSVEDIVYYLQNREKFTIAPYFVRQEMVRNDSLDVYLKFLTSQELQMIQNKSHQIYLVKQLNESFYKLNDKEILYCMKIVSKFGEHAINQLQLSAITQKIKQYQDNSSYLEGIYYLHKIDPKIILQHERILSLINQQTINSVKLIFMLKTILSSKQFKITSQQNKKIIQKATKAIKNYQKQQIKFAIRLLQFFPMLRIYITLDNISTQDYLLYLKTAPVSLKYHSLPTSVLKDTNAYKFQQICKQRVKLDYDSPLEITIKLQNWLTKGMQEVVGLIRFLSQQEIQDHRVWATLQQTVIKEFALSYHITGKQLLAVFRKYELTSILKVFGAMAIAKQGSMIFWKFAFSFVYTVLKDQSILKKTDPEDEKQIIIYLHQIFTHKPPKQEIQQTLMQLTLLCLARNRWKIKQLLPLTISLRVSKAGDHQVWFGIEKKLMSISLQAIHDSNTKQKLLWILNNFIAMNKGSYRFWTHFSKYLSNQEKQSIYQFIKNDQSMIKKYLQH